MAYICGEEIGPNRRGNEAWCHRKVKAPGTKCSIHNGSPKPKPSKLEKLQVENKALRNMLRKVVQGDLFDEKALDRLLEEEEQDAPTDSLALVAAAMDSLGVISAGNNDDPRRWSVSDLMTDILTKLK